jgi:quercetin dioxygenase-like cupin family protein
MLAVKADGKQRMKACVSRRWRTRVFTVAAIAFVTVSAAADSQPESMKRHGIAMSVVCVVLAAVFSAVDMSAQSTILNRSTFQDLDVRAKWAGLHSVIKTARDEGAEVVFQEIVAAPGTPGGWHTHPAMVFVTVAQGVLTYYDEHDPCNGIEFPAGTGFVEEAHGDVVHLARNEGTVPVVLYLMYVVEKGEELRTPQPAPPGACF